MARNDNGAATATAEDVEQAEMFPELDDGNEAHKELLKAAKRFAKAKVDRDELLSTAKEKVDGAMERLIAQMHETGLTKFKHGGITVEIIPSKEKAQVKIDTEDDEGSE